jgi:hypothetical protein
MGVLDLTWHLANLFAVPLLMGLIAAALAKLFWRQALARVRWHRLAWAAAAATCLTTLVGLLVFGRDGRMATYAVMVVACATALWWAGWRRAG